MKSHLRQTITKLSSCLSRSLLFTFIVITATGFQPTFAQNITLSRSSAALGDTTVFEIHNLNPLQPIQNLPAPFYSYLWVLGDGNFVTGVEKVDTIKYLYSDSDLTTSPLNPEVTAYFSGNYGGGKEPPLRAVSGTVTDRIPISNASAVKTPFKEWIPDTASLNLQFSSRGIRPQDTFALVLSYKNKYDATINATLHLFYDSRIDTTSILDDTETIPDSGARTRGTRAPSPPQFGEFNFNRNLIYNQLATFDSSLILSPVPLEGFQEMLSYSIPELGPNQEKHIFIELVADSIMWDAIAGDQQGRVRFLAVLLEQSFNNDFEVSPNDISFNDKEEQLIELNNTSSLINRLQDSPIGSQGTTFQTLAIEEITAEIVASHDPNSIRVEACDCPKPQDNRKKLLTRVKFSNEGGTNTTKILVRLDLPSNIAFDSLIYRPEMADTNFVLRDPGFGGSLEFELNNYALFPEADFGIGHPLTYAELVFTLITETAIDVADIPPLEACITFDNNAAEEVCTGNADIYTISNSSEAASEILECQECPKPEEDFKWPSFCFDNMLICLLIFVLILIILILIVLRFLKKS